MPHQTLYRKHRPKNFTGIYGQNHIKAVLRGSIIGDKVGQAYLFSGPRGIGKTSVARIFAKAINCQNPEKGEPCNNCDYCQLIIDDKSIDIIEIDAASHRGIDEIRDLRERVSLPPQVLKKKIYIIDEVHMLTNEAFNALLKTLEEPPAHSVFILATTEPHKVPATIQSRTQRLNFYIGSSEQIFNYLKDVTKEEKISITDEALKLIASISDGGFRDAVSALEQVMHEEGEITEERVRQTLGLGEHKATEELVEEVISGQNVKSFQILEKLTHQGANASFIHRLIIENLRAKLRESLGLSNQPEEPEKTQKIIKILEDFIEITLDLRNSPLPFLPIEIVVAKHGQSAKTQHVASLPEEKSNDAPVVSNISNLDDWWPQFLTKLKNHNNSLSYFLANSKIDEQTDDEIKTSVKYSFHRDRLMEQKNRQLIESVIQQVVGKKLIFICAVSSSPSMEEDLAQAAEEILGV